MDKKKVLLSLMMFITMSITMWAEPVEQKVGNEEELNAAISAAMTAGGEQTITITDNITLTANLKYLSAYPNIPFILTIQSEVSQHYTINGGGEFSLIYSSLNSDNGSEITIQNLTLTGGKGMDPTGTGGGGAIYCANLSKVTIENVAVKECSALAYGGGIYINKGVATLTNVLVADCSVGFLQGMLMMPSYGGDGGGIALLNGEGTLSNVTIASNTANEERTISQMFPPSNITYQGGNAALYTASPTAGGYSLDKCIIWGNSSKKETIIGDSPAISNSIVQGGYEAGTNIQDIDPELDANNNATAAAADGMGFAADSTPPVDTTPRVNVTYANGTTGTVDAANLANGSLDSATKIELSGSWNAELMSKLCEAIHTGGNSTTTNNILQTVTYASGAAIIGDVIDLRYLFAMCQALTSVDFPACSAAVDLNNAFTFCSLLERINSETAGVFDLTSFAGGVKNATYAFYGCEKAVSIQLPAYTADVVLFNVTFRNCTSLRQINSTKAGEFDLTAFSTGINNLQSCFSNCPEVESIKLPAYTAGSVNLKSAFTDCKKLKAINSNKNECDLTAFTGGISNMEQTFAYCTALYTINLPANPTVEVSLKSTFQACSSLEFINGLEEFKNISDLSKTFSGCSNMLAVQLGSVPADDAKLVETFKSTNLNCLKYLPAGDNTTAALASDLWKNYTNFIVGGEACDNIILTDKDPFHCPTVFTLKADKSIIYTRSSWNWNSNGSGTGWTTLSLPFDATMVVDGETKTQAKADDSQVGDYKLKKFVGTETREDDILMKFAHEQAAGPRADVGYLISLPGNMEQASKISFVSQPGITFDAMPMDMYFWTDYTNYIYRPFYIKIPAGDSYLLDETAKDAFVWTDDWNNIQPPFRALFTGPTPTTDSAKRLLIADESGATSLAGEKEALNSEATYKVMTRDGLRIVKGDKTFSLEGIEIVE